MPAGADQWIDRYSFSPPSTETLGVSNTSYGANLSGQVCVTAADNDANPKITTANGQPRASIDRQPSDAMTLTTPTYTVDASGRWMVRKLRVVNPCFDDGTGDGPVPRPYPGDPSTDANMQNGNVAYWKAHGAPSSIQYSDLKCQPPTASSPGYQQPSAITYQTLPSRGRSARWGCTSSSPPTVTTPSGLCPSTRSTPSNRCIRCPRRNRPTSSRQPARLRDMTTGSTWWRPCRQS